MNKEIERLSKRIREMEEEKREIFAEIKTLNDRLENLERVESLYEKKVWSLVEHLVDQKVRGDLKW